MRGAIFRSVLIEWTGKSPQRGGGNATVKRRKLNYRFHDPNPAAVTADYILKIFIEVNAEKVEAAIQQTAASIPAPNEKSVCCEGRPV